VIFKRIATFFITAALIGSTTTAAIAETEDPKKVQFAAEGGWPSFHPNGDLLVTEAGFEDSVYTNELYDVNTGELITKFSTPNNTGKYIFSPEGTYMVSSGEYTVIRDGITAELLYELPYNWARISFKTSEEEIAAFVHGNFLDKNTVTIYDFSKKEVLFEKQYSTTANMHVAHHPEEPVVAVSHGRDLEVINYETDEVIASIPNIFNLEENQAYHAIWGLTFSPSGEKLALISSAKDEQILMLDAINHYEKIELEPDQFKNISLKPNNDDFRWVSVGYTPDGMMIYTVNYDGIKFYNDETGELTETITSHLTSTDLFSFSNYPNYLAIERKIRQDASHQTFVQVMDFPYTSPTGNRITFEDPYLYLNTGQTTYYGMDYYFEGTKTLLDPRQVTLTSDNPDVVTIDESRKMIANSEGSTIVRAHYRGFSSIINVHVRDLEPSRIHVDPLYDSSFYINGKTDPNETVFTWFGGREYRVTSDTEGKFSFFLDKPLTANTRIRVMTHSAGDIYSHVLRDTIAPVVPIVSQVNDQYDTVAGKAEPLTTLRIQMGTTTKSVRSDMKGIYKLQIPGIKAGQRLDIKTQDRAGNLSKSKVMSVVDKTPPVLPKINKLTTASTSVTGYAEAKSAVYVSVNSKVYKTSAATNSTYKVIIPKQKKYTKVYVYAVDAAGNRSKTAVTTVQ
jgi:plasmid maintenance system killer protein